MPGKKERELDMFVLKVLRQQFILGVDFSNKNEIQLPEYWDGLIDPETITVSLTQIGSSQDLMVDKIEWGKKIIIRSGNASAIDCFYEVKAARH